MRTTAACLLLALLTSGAAADGPAPPYGPWGVDLTGRNLTIRPGDDFFGYVNGAWLARTPIPTDKPSAGVDRQMIDTVDERTRRILEGGAGGVAEEAKDEARKLADFYASFTDEARVERLDLAPIEAQLHAIRSAASREDLMRLQGEAPRLFGMTLFGLSIDSDMREPKRHALHLGQRGLGLPDRDYYLAASFGANKTAYEAYAAELLRLVGWDNPTEAAFALVAFETEVAKASWSATDKLDPDKTYNPTDPDSLARDTRLPIRDLLARAGFPKLDRIVVTERDPVLELAAIWNRTDVSTLRAWQAFHLLDQAAPFLSDRFVQANFRFRKTELDGIVALAPRWQRGVQTVGGNMGEAIGRVYVARHVPTSLKGEIEAMMGHVREALRQRLARNEWMSPSTREKALEKARMLQTKLVFPAKWRDYSALRIAPDDLVGNLERSFAFEWDRQVARFDEPVDRQEWNSTPQTVNAFYEWSLNMVTLPAGQLQPPSYDPKADPAVNYGAVGALLAHELIHGFDSIGRKFDGAGRLMDWWAPDDAAEFERRSGELGRQYDKVEALPGLFVNGTLTMSENIADLGGVQVALDAYRLSLGGKDAPVIDGTTGAQRFFLGYAQAWRAKMTDEWLKSQLVSDTHAPHATRVNGVVRNVDTWYEAFGIGPGHALYLPPEKRVRLW